MRRERPVAAADNVVYHGGAVGFERGGIARDIVKGRCGAVVALECGCFVESRRLGQWLSLH